MIEKKLPIVMAILDGWGISPSWGGNSISMAETVNFNYFWRNFPHTPLTSLSKISSIGKAIGSSEICHQIISAGRSVPQDSERISESIADKSFYQNQVLILAAKNSLEYNSAFHIIGLLSDGGIQSHLEHLFALLKFSKFHGLHKVYIHIITDGIDSQPTGAFGFIRDLEKQIREVGVGEIATIIGREYALDSNGRFEKIKIAAQMLNFASGNYFDLATAAISTAYKNGIKDQSIPPSVIRKNTHPITKISDNDSVIFFNFHSEESKELTTALLGFQNIGQKVANNLFFVSFANHDFSEEIKKRIHFAFPPNKINQTLGEVLSNNGIAQFRIANYQKYTHITKSFNSGLDKLFPSEERVLIGSAKTADYFSDPTLNIEKINNRLISAIKSKKFQFLLVNFANADLVAHGGDLLATSKAVSAIDIAIGKLWQFLSTIDGTLIIVADHGNVEQMIPARSAFDRQSFHTISPVPFVLVRNDLKKVERKQLINREIIIPTMEIRNSLADVAPTILELFEIKKPLEMTGQSLLRKIIKEKK